MSNSMVERMVIEDASYPLLQEHLNRYVFASQLVRQKRVLDIACGSGYGLNYLKRRGAMLAVGVDIAREACQQARSSYGADVVIADATRLPFRDCSFEITVSFETIEHLPMPHSFLQECVRLLEIGGKIVISTPNRTMSIFQDNPYHVQEYKPQHFVKLLQQYFSHIQIYGQLYRPYLLRWVGRVTAKVLSLLPGGQRLFNLIQKQLFGQKISKQKDLSAIDETYKVTPIDDLKSKLVQPSFIVCTAEVSQK